MNLFANEPMDAERVTVPKPPLVVRATPTMCVMGFLAPRNRTHTPVHRAPPRERPNSSMNSGERLGGVTVSRSKRSLGPPTTPNRVALFEQITPASAVFGSNSRSACRRRQA